ncbi:anthranilate synthase component I family protein [Croceimicrobium hydrocarbonivorans]|uniref:Anthranilate synthase component I family protein n=1 Tax=Croceimicrobium hydrocarbonivorans TaxID=2761580 RepID=A0A7H0VHS6_9FLAO|nr:anthranilate synthase component I family protein [Croceimicrobium hydrocarbonivorans]QNR25274.1 anthranilate synthase component I family protein [Croceimicrobium hydrocarbonivorans]
MSQGYRFAWPEAVQKWQQLESLAASSEHCILLDSHQHKDLYGSWDKILAWGARAIYQGDFEGLKTFRQEHKDWLFGHLAYDLKNQLEDLDTRHPQKIAWADLQFFVPETILLCKEGQCEVLSWHYANQEALETNLNLESSRESFPKLNFEAQTSREVYLQDIQSLKQELQYGNIYEINYCTLFEARGPMCPLQRFQELNEKHQAPFSAYYRDKQRHLLCFSPERYLRKKGDELISQPIKGTAARAQDPVRDQEQKAHLLSSEKERAENVMIVDLVRNDLSRTARRNSVSVPELFGLYSFNAVHQMISTVRSELDSARYTLEDALHYSFPMGSMTGAPKVSAMQLIDRHEHFRRGLYSGALGYIDPDGNFDFNVVIRSIAYDAEQKYAQVAVGSAITIHCDAEAEYAECLLKAEKLIR